MTKLMLKLFVKDHENTKSTIVREKYGLLSSVVGINLNILLFAVKFFIGTITNSIAITADAINNLADSGSNIVTLVSFKMSNRKPDKEHPFGHGRFEYIAALIVGFLVVIMGLEIIKTSIDKIMNPSEVSFSMPAVIVLCISILVKIWLAIFNRKLSKKIDSPALLAVSTDSMSDTVSTAATVACLVVSKFTNIALDGYVGIIVAGFILFAAYCILRETIGVILGKPPSKELVDDLIEYILSHDHVSGTHDLVIHSYGAANIFASIHVEIPADKDVLKMHDTIDLIEKDVLEKFGIQIVIHLDPLAVDDKQVNAMRAVVKAIVKTIDKDLKIHDFRLVSGSSHSNLIFDLVIPFDYKYSEKQLKEMIDEKVQSIDENYFAVVTVEHSFV
ncbi:MAG: cation diffusion facilitator family transporter [Clostridia bacterium]